MLYNISCIKLSFLAKETCIIVYFFALLRHLHFTQTVWTISIIVGETFLLILPMYSSSTHLSAFLPNDFLQNDPSVKSSSNLRLVSPPQTKRRKHSLQHTAQPITSGRSCSSEWWTDAWADKSTNDGLCHGWKDLRTCVFYTRLLCSKT